jgi:peptidoglycan/xylan/chitin deacetylase (PgdA/CDA1 family)
MRTVSLLFHDVYAADPRESGFGSPAADRYKLLVGQFDAQLAGLAQVRADAPVLVQDISGGLKPEISCVDDDEALWRSGRHVSPDRARRRCPYLITVDDGGVSYYTVVADRLEARRWRGHCFVSTDAIGTRGFLSASQLRELDTRGHVIGSHSASHPTRFSACEAAHMRQEWTRSRMVLEDLLGHEVLTASVPGGYYSRRVARSARDAGLRLIFTSEPITASHDEDGILVMGRFTLRPGHPTDRAGRLAGREPWARYQEWASWRAKGAVKPLLGPLYSPAADWVLSRVSPSQAGR